MAIEMHNKTDVLANQLANDIASLPLTETYLLF